MRRWRAGWRTRSARCKLLTLLLIALLAYGAEPKVDSKKAERLATQAAKLEKEGKQSEAAALYAAALTNLGTLHPADHREFA